MSAGHVRHILLGVLDWAKAQRSCATGPEYTDALDDLAAAIRRVVTFL
jgi:hypothetical protein